MAIENSNNSVEWIFPTPKSKEQKEREARERQARERQARREQERQRIADMTPEQQKWLAKWQFDEKFERVKTMNSNWKVEITKEVVVNGRKEIQVWHIETKQEGNEKKIRIVWPLDVKKSLPQSEYELSRNVKSQKFSLKTPKLNKTEISYEQALMDSLPAIEYRVKQWEHVKDEKDKAERVRKAQEKRVSLIRASEFAHAQDVDEADAMMDAFLA